MMSKKSNAKSKTSTKPKPERNRNKNPLLEKEDKDRPLPPSSTSAEPGSPEKIAIMCQRNTDGYHIHHPEDCVDYSVFSAILFRLKEIEERGL